MKVIEADARQCPRCATSLESGVAGGHVEAALCRGCAGTLLDRAALGALLGVLAHESYAEVSAAANLPAVRDEHVVVDCPACHTRMEHTNAQAYALQLLGRNFGFYQFRSQPNTTGYNDATNRSAIVTLNARSRPGFVSTRRMP